MTDRSPSVTSEAWQKALDCAYSIMEDYFAKPHISTEAGRKKALDEAMQHAFGMLSLGLAQAAPEPLDYGDELLRWSNIEVALRKKFPTLNATGIEIDNWPALIDALAMSSTD